AALAKINEQARAATKSVAELRKLLASTPDSEKRETISKAFAETLVPRFSTILPAVNQFQDRSRTYRELLMLSFSLAAYRAEQGQFPSKLGELVPKYVGNIPDDIFSGAALLYRREG